MDIEVEAERSVGENQDGESSEFRSGFSHRQIAGTIQEHRHAADAMHGRQQQ